MFGIYTGRALSLTGRHIRYLGTSRQPPSHSVVSGRAWPPPSLSHRPSSHFSDLSQQHPPAVSRGTGQGLSTEAPWHFCTEYSTVGLLQSSRTHSSGHRSPHSLLDCWTLIGIGDTTIDALKGADRSLQELLYHRREAGRGRREERKAHTKAASPASPASTKARAPVRSREAGLERGARRVLRGLRAAPSAPRAAPRAPRAGARRCGGGSGRTAGAPRAARLPGPQRSRATPRRPRAPAPAPRRAPSAGAAARAAGAGPLLTCAPSAEQRAEESGGARAGHPRRGPCGGGGSVGRLGRQEEDASLCCLFMRPRRGPGIGRRGDVLAPPPLAPTPSADASRP